MGHGARPPRSNLIIRRELPVIQISKAMAVLFAAQTLATGAFAENCRVMKVRGDYKKVCFPEGHVCKDPHGIGDGRPIPTDCFTGGSRGCHRGWPTWPNCNGGWIADNKPDPDEASPTQVEPSKDDMCRAAHRQLQHLQNSYLPPFGDRQSCQNDDDCSYVVTESWQPATPMNKTTVASYQLMTGDANFSRLNRVTRANCTQYHPMVIYPKPSGVSCQDFRCVVDYHR